LALEGLAKPGIAESDRKLAITPYTQGPLSSTLNPDLEEEEDEDEESTENNQKSQLTFTSGVEYWPDESASVSEELSGGQDPFK
jgi:hypothetical protein